MNQLFATEKLQALYPKIKAFVEEELYPTELHLLQDSWENTEPILRSKREKAKALGIWAPHLPEEDGGQGLTMTEFGQVSELLGTSVIGHYVLNCQAPDIGNMELLHQFANDELKEKYMWPLMNGGRSSAPLRDRAGSVQPGRTRLSVRIVCAVWLAAAE